jgi:hypothetical protein
LLKNNFHKPCGVTRDGRRFLMVQQRAQKEATPTQINVVLNWVEELKRRVPTCRAHGRRTP